jgi:hypothetical protein
LGFGALGLRWVWGVSEGSDGLTVSCADSIVAF